MKNACFAVVLLGLSACTTDRVTTEFGDLNALVTSTATTLNPKLKPGLEADRQAEITAAAQAGDIWFLSDDCNKTLSADTTVPAANCTITKVAINDRAPVIGQATAANRKLQTLRNYVTSLELLMDSKLEQDVVTAYSAALSSFGSLGEAAENQSLLDFLKKRANDKDKVDAVVTQAVATLRYNRMRSVVRKSRDDVNSVARELQSLLITLGVDGGFQTRVAALKAAETKVLEADTSDAVAYRALLVDLETAHKEFMTYYEGTSIYAVGMIARVHDTLANALASHGSVEDVVSYLEALKTLSNTIEG